MAMAVAAPSTEEVAEKTSFTLTLVSFGEKKIDVIKVVREITNLGLTEAKAIVDAAPKAVLQDVNKTVAEEAKAKLEAAGAKVEIK
jgi:large subunit ribosomal protein L7/L12